VKTGGLQFEISLGKKSVRPYLRNKLGMVVIPVIPATQETGSLSAVHLGKSRRPYLKNRLKTKRVWLKW
jgi:hypothetical protein